MAAIFTARLWASTNVSAGTVTQTVGTAGNTVVVRDISATCQNNPAGYRAAGIIFRDPSTNIIIWQLQEPNITNQVTYRFDGRLVLAAANQIQVQTFEPSWSWIVSGYNLTP